MHAVIASRTASRSSGWNRSTHSLSVSGTPESGGRPNILRLCGHSFSAPVARSRSQHPAGIVELIIDIFRRRCWESCKGPVSRTASVYYPTFQIRIGGRGTSIRESVLDQLSEVGQAGGSACSSEERQA